MKKILFIIIVCLVNISFKGLSQWSQLGSPIDGVASGDELGYNVAISGDGNVIALGARFMDSSNSSNVGGVLVYELSGNQWIQKGSILYGEDSGEEAGTRVDLNYDGSVVAFGSPDNSDNGSNSGQVRVYEWISNSWMKKGTDINFPQGSFLAGAALDSAGMTVIVSGRSYNSSTGKARVYEWQNGNWSQKGSDINGIQSNDKFGQDVDINFDGSKIVVGALGPGEMRVFEWSNNSWGQLGGSISASSSGGQFGRSVSMNRSGTIVASGAPTNSNGEVGVFEWNGSSWAQKGVFLNGDNYGDRFGYGVSLAKNGDYLSVGAFSFDGNGSESGQLKVFKWDNPSSSWIESASFVGSNSGDRFGFNCAISGDGKRVVAGATYNDTPGSNSGQAIVYEFVCESHDTINISECISYTVPSGDEIYTSSGTYLDTIPNVFGCDSLITINLTINNPSITTINEFVCDSYTVPSGDETYTSSGIYLDTISSSVGCDSILIVDLEVGVTSSLLNVTSCDSFTISGSGKTYYTSGTYHDTIINAFGCDSIITINLTIDSLDKSVTSVTTSILLSNESNASYQWIDCETMTPIPGETKNLFRPDENGIYAVALDNGSCVDTSNCFEITQVSFNEYRNSSRIDIYPNPVSDFVKIKIAGDKPNYKFMISDYTGKRLKDGRFNNGMNILDLSNNAQGVYFLRVEGNIYRVIKN
ncbi:T9SS type A sorting domain-containing protein [Salibacter halophilus]|uniref:T9SS type A sorting domain-containing protein n=1 Tax=Salibacter halophilus TaxID=1803916 RepID=A0A6N6M9V3_9FLAO|nr:T9SS type A sorting domain-containing protein [Salibacter halophilus]KAB1065036.1 T9SS type A sorting domain-containing protein [Salibacter halophilus]